MKWAWLCIVILLAGCSLNRATSATPTLTPLPPTATVTDDWTAIAPGVWERSITVRPPLTLAAFEMPIVRIDPTQVIFRVHYQPREWFTLPEWRERLPDALIIVNGSFFTEFGEAVGLVVADGQPYGQSLHGFGGMFQVVKDEVRVRSLVQEPYQDGTFNQAVQGFPMLVEPDGQAANTGPGFDDPARRTIIAQDSAGHILLMVTPAGRLTLRNAQRWLLQSELDIDVAFGLDGGKSTGMAITAPQLRTYPSLDPVPVVIAVYPR